MPPDLGYDIEWRRSAMSARISRLSALFVVSTVGVVLSVASPARAEGPVGLGTATSFAVLAGQTITNTGGGLLIRTSARLYCIRKAADRD